MGVHCANLWWHGADPMSALRHDCAFCISGFARKCCKVGLEERSNALPRPVVSILHVKREWTTKVKNEHNRLELGWMKGTSVLKLLHKFGPCFSLLCRAPRSSKLNQNYLPTEFYLEILKHECGLTESSAKTLSLDSQCLWEKETTNC